MANTIITIGREFGSLGHQVGEKVAEKLGIKLYDKELLQKAAKESGLCEEIFHDQDERPTNSFLYSLVMDTYSAGSYTTASFLDMPLNHKVFLAQFDTIRKIAEQESCVVMGRCADYALEETPGVLSVFIHADMEDKIPVIAERFHVTESKAREMIQKTDKQRSSYYNYYTNKKWGDARSYDLCINTSKLTLDDAADFIISYYNLMKK